MSAVRQRGTAVRRPFNPPELSELSYRVGTHESFVRAMRASLARSDPMLARGSLDDFALAAIDAWGVIGDVLTFYQERIANEGYMGTAQEPRSFVELARLTGYRSDPGMAAETQLAFTMQDGYAGEVPRGTRAQSVPGTGEKPQSFETTVGIEARAEWNELAVRTARPASLNPDDLVPPPDQHAAALYFKGTSTNLKPNDPLLFVFSIEEQGKPVTKLSFVESLEADTGANRTRVLVKPVLPPAPDAQKAQAPKIEQGANAAAENASSQPKAEAATTPPELALVRRVGAAINGTTAANGEPVDTAEPAPAIPGFAPRALEAFDPGVGSGVTATVAQPQSGPPDVTVYAFRNSATVFGQRAPRQPRYGRGNRPLPDDRSTEWSPATDEAENILFLDRVYEDVGPTSAVGSRYLAVAVASDDPNVQTVGAYEISDAANLARDAYGMRGLTTRLTIQQERVAEILVPPPPVKLHWWQTQTSLLPEAGWWDPQAVNLDPVATWLRKATVYVQSQPVELAEIPLEDPVEGDIIELDQVYPSIEAGRPLVLTGEAAGTPGVRVGETVELQSIQHQATGTPPRYSTSLQLTSALSRSYRRDTVKIFGNVAAATHGESLPQPEVLGSGDATKMFQQFPLRYTQLTYVRSADPAPALLRDRRSTLEVRVGDVAWSETESLGDAGPDDRVFVTFTDETGITQVMFGDGVTGARLPTGSENVTATYRHGTGRDGNISNPNQIRLLASSPLGARAVSNPLPATGGIDPEPPHAFRHGSIAGLRSLGALVSADDYADLAASYAGIGQARAEFDADAGRVDIVVADSLGRTLPPGVAQAVQAWLQSVDESRLNLRVRGADVHLLALTATIGTDDPAAPADVIAAVRATLLDRYELSVRPLGVGLYQSDVATTIQLVRGVAYVELTRFAEYSADDASNLRDLPESPRPRSSEADPTRSSALPTSYLRR